ncbi:MAG TPA: hypothetical protein VF503_11990 [Sphingobium sp.]|uniref:hypothetical protein n=1 Tax=Sphingobium sp. TaxID=1912891 RepID=UPI002ED55116
MREVFEEREHCVPDLPAVTLEIDVDALGAGRHKPLGRIRRVMIDDSVKSRFTAHERAFA